jgi:hypothetical protein
MLDVLRNDGATTSHLAQDLEHVCVIEVRSGSANSPHAAAMVERCAATMTELHGPLPARLLCEIEDGSGWRRPHSVLSTCSRLEVLTDVLNYKPAVWLGLSQLHTLRGVDLNQVSMAAIAAALPRLHTLVAHGWFPIHTRTGTDGAVASVAGFFADLLPRLRVFHFSGTWPEKNAAQSASAPPPLPGLDELVWQNNYIPGTSVTAHRGFLGAQPTVLHAPITEWLTGCGAPGGGARGGFLARVCEFCAVKSVGTEPADVSDIARVLRAAPRLRTFGSDARTLVGDMAWLTATAAPLHPAFENLVHPLLRRLFINTRGGGGRFR